MFFIYLIWNVVFNLKGYVNAIQDDITGKTVPFWLHHTVFKEVQEAEKEVEEEKDERGPVEDVGGRAGDVQGDQLNMAVFFWYLVKSALLSVRYCIRHVFMIPKNPGYV